MAVKRGSKQFTKELKIARDLEKEISEAEALLEGPKLPKKRTPVSTRERARSPTSLDSEKDTETKGDDELLWESYADMDVARKIREDNSFSLECLAAYFPEPFDFRMSKHQ